MRTISYLRILVAAALVAGLVPDAAAQPTSTKLKLLSPGGGESFKPGDTITVKWSGIGSNTSLTRQLKIDSVVVELSADGGNRWQMIGASDSWKDSLWLWTVPNIQCADCRLRVRQVAGNLGRGDLADSAVIPELDGIIPLTASISATGKFLVLQTKFRLFVLDLERRKFLHQLTLRDTAWKYRDVRYARGDTFLIAGVEFNQLRSGLDSSVIQIWNLHTGELVHSLRGRYWFEPIPNELREYDRSASMHPTLPYLVVAGVDNPIVWNLETGSIIDTIPVQPADSAKGFPALTAQYSPDGSRIAYATANQFGIWDTERRTLTVQIRPKGSGLVRFSEDGRFVAASGNFVFDPISGDTVFIVPLQTGQNMWLAATRARAVFGDLIYDFSSPDRFQWYEELRVSFASSTSRFALHSGGDTVVEWGLTALYWHDISRSPMDMTDGPFSVTGALPVVVSQFAGSVELGGSHDTLLEGFIVNGGTAPVGVDNISITGENTGDFAIVSGGGPYMLAIGETAPIGIRFTPSDTGLRRAMFLVRTDLGDVEAQLFGIGTKRTTTVKVDALAGNASGIAMGLRPNPVSDHVQLRFRTWRTSFLELNVYNTVGALVDRVPLGLVEEGDYDVDYDVSRLGAGLYRIELRSGSGSAGQMMHVVR